MWVGWVVFAVGGFWLGQRWSDFRDLMMARRVAQIVEQRQKLRAEREEWEEITEQGSGGLVRVGRRFSRSLARPRKGD